MASTRVSTRSEYFGRLNITVKRAQDPGADDYELFLATALNGDVDNAKRTTSLPGSFIEWNESLEFDITTPEFSFSLGLWKKTSRTKLIREFTYRHDDSTDELELDGWHYFHDSKPDKPIRSVLLHLHYEPTKTFGVNIEKLCRRSGGGIPVIMQNIFDYLETTVPALADFFRSSPPASDLLLLKSWVSAYDKGHSDTVDFSQCKVSGTVRLLLTQFLRELPDSLIPVRFLQQYLSANNKGAAEEKEQDFKQLIRDLPQYSQQCLLHLILAFKFVQRNSNSTNSLLKEKNKRKRSGRSGIYATMPSYTSLKEPYVPWGFYFGNYLLFPPNFKDQDLLKKLQDATQFLFDHFYSICREFHHSIEEALTSADIQLNSPSTLGNGSSNVSNLSNSERATHATVLAPQELENREARPMTTISNGIGSPTDKSAKTKKFVAHKLNNKAKKKRESPVSSSQLALHSIPHPPAPLNDSALSSTPQTSSSSGSPNIGSVSDDIRYRKIKRRDYEKGPLDAPQGKSNSCDFAPVTASDEEDDFVRARSASITRSLSSSKLKNNAERSKLKEKRRPSLPTLPLASTHLPFLSPTSPGKRTSSPSPLSPTLSGNTAPSLYLSDTHGRPGTPIKRKDKNVSRWERTSLPSSLSGSPRTGANHSILLGSARGSPRTALTEVAEQLRRQRRWSCSEDDDRLRRPTDDGHRRDSTALLTVSDIGGVDSPPGLMRIASISGEPRSDRHVSFLASDGSNRSARVLSSSADTQQRAPAEMPIKRPWSFGAVSVSASRCAHSPEMPSLIGQRRKSISAPKHGQKIEQPPRARARSKSHEFGSSSWQETVDTSLALSPSSSSLPPVPPPPPPLEILFEVSPTTIRSACDDQPALPEERRRRRPLTPYNPARLSAPEPGANFELILRYFQHLIDHNRGQAHVEEAAKEERQRRRAQLRTKIFKDAPVNVSAGMKQPDEMNGQTASEQASPHPAASSTIAGVPTRRKWRGAVSNGSGALQPSLSSSQEPQSPRPRVKWVNSDIVGVPQNGDADSQDLALKPRERR